ncbi:hypothetical protein [Mesorhizobium sp.]|uniref:hypothetical protein n=1 Tax=Mesorhizobium sp. TaxID=1871066 RepID=UPI000FE74519|nr:hypothetical protein [Mesorhizobium sp.]RWE57173.1 MAG: hypothetical protein EOS67_15015 [Mesorhizobium sp.]
MALTWKAADHEDLETIIGPSGYRARLVGTERRPDPDGPVMSFEINWRRPDKSPRPTDLLTGEHCDIEKFDLLSEAITATVIAKRPGTKANNGIRIAYRQLEYICRAQGIDRQQAARFGTTIG